MKKLLEKTYSEIGSNIAFAEAKNGALITLNTAIIALSSGLVFTGGISLHYRWLFAIFAVLMILPLTISLFSFSAALGDEWTIIKRINKAVEKNRSINDSPLNYPPKYMSFEYIHFNLTTPEKYLEAIGSNIDSVLPNSLKYQLAIQIIALSRVAYRKFALFNLAIKLELIILIASILVSVVVLMLKLFGC